MRENLIHHFLPKIFLFLMNDRTADQIEVSVRLTPIDSVSLRRPIGNLSSSLRLQITFSVIVLDLVESQ